jgi:hypothetical protein
MRERTTEDPLESAAEDYRETGDDRGFQRNIAALSRETVQFIVPCTDYFDRCRRCGTAC